MSGVRNYDFDVATRPLAFLIEDLHNEVTSGEAINEILRRFHPLLRKYWRWQRVCEYEEFLQEVMVRLFGALPNLRDPNAFPGLLRRIVLATAADLLRRNSLEHVDIADVNPEHFAVDFDESTSTPLLVRSYLELLPPREREVLYLSYFDDLDPTEVSKRLGVSAGAIRMTKSRALARLRTLLGIQVQGSPHDAL